MSTFGSKRKARKIQVDEDEDEVAIATAETTTHTTEVQKSVSRKPFKKSNLRQSLAFDDEPGENTQEDTTNVVGNDEPASKPGVARTSSTSIRAKKKKASSRLSFGPGEIISGDAAEALEDDEAFLPKKAAFGRRVMESNALRKTLPGVQNLSIRSFDDEERPTYSKDYINELKNSTPSTPKNEHGHDADVEDVGLDESELEGAVVVDTSEQVSYILSEAEIREKKERRARLAKEQDFISLTETDDDRRQLSLLPARKKTESRLVREDEDMAEGFDEFVDDGRISLGKKAERAAKRKMKKDMEAMIQEAEGGSSDNDSDDSEAERRAAYEFAQTRAGMDGLKANKNNTQSENHVQSQIPPKISPLPVLSECLESLQTTLNGLEQALGQRKRKIEDLEEEKVKLARREGEVQRLLKEAGERYSALRADSGVSTDPKDKSGPNAGPSTYDPFIGSRGLESFGNTPIARQEVEDVG